MKWYCNSCKKMHEDEELCPKYKQQLKEHPEWLKEAADFTTVAGQHYLITSQALDGVAKGVNKLAGTQLSYEGTQQFARDIQVFKRLSEEPFARAGVFSSPENAKAYLDNVRKVAETTPKTFTTFESKLTGYSQEVDWLRMKKGEISSLWQKSSLLSDNAAGIDGTTINRFTGKEISRTTVKASKNQMTSNSTAIRDVKEAIYEKGTATENDIIFGPKGTAEAARKAGLKNPVVEKNSAEQIRNSNSRQIQKIDEGKAFTNVTTQELGKKMAQGAVIGAVVSLTISSITNYMKYKNGEISGEEAFREVSEETVKGAITGAATTAVSIFLPAGAIGFVAGVAVGIYISKTCGNLLDEIYGKGAYGAILDASGYVYGMTFNLADYYEKIERNNRMTARNIAEAEKIQQRIERNFDVFEQMKGE